MEEERGGEGGGEKEEGMCVAADELSEPLTLREGPMFLMKELLPEKVAWLKLRKTTPRLPSFPWNKLCEKEC